MLLLSPGDTFPSITLTTEGDEQLVVPDFFDTEATGAFVNPDPRFLQSTGFILDPAGTVLVSVYSSGAIGRLVPEDVIGMIGYVREHASASA